MSTLGDVFGDIFGGGGGGGDAGMGGFLDWLRQSQKDQEKLTKREKQRAETLTGVRRAEFADRPGFAGLVGVGGAVKRTDVTLATEMERLPADSPERMAYDAAKAKEAEGTALATRTMTGEQYRVEDAYSAIKRAAREREYAAPGSARTIEKEISAVEKLTGENPWFDVGDKLTKLQAELERRRNRPRPRPPVGTSPTGNES